MVMQLSTCRLHTLQIFALCVNLPVKLQHVLHSCFPVLSAPHGQMHTAEAQPGKCMPHRTRLQ